MARFTFYGNFVELELVSERSLRLQQQCIGVMEYTDNSIISSRSRNVKSANWRKPDLGWYKLNIDGAHKSFTAEMWGMVERLMLAWKSGQHRLILEVDSIDVINVLTNNAKDGEINFIRKARDYLKEWDVVIQHIYIYREGNKLADGLESMDWRQTLQSVFYCYLTDQLGADIIGVMTPKIDNRTLKTMVFIQSFRL
ncbi:hypothetical protein PVK06_015157 [Gossypium arboreum]|uniref:RNase H type-1 domain-containing protein n=1 Tax=Gossypium arboreum TaxID=29729 RepID=A0ABR0PWQ8_GOSAR|nr:hypothetical protein PVK06_015157 [Gossypium arboreum]